MSKVKHKIESLEQHWKLEIPEAFSRLYHSFETPFISPCEFLPLDQLTGDSERWSGMLPQFLPFGHDGAEDFYGFYVPPFGPQGDYPVLYWDHEYDHYVPIASGFAAFLRWCVIQGRFLAQDSFEEDDPQFAEEEEHRRDFARTVGLPRSLVLEPLPRNDRELYEKLAQSDPQGAQALCQLGAHHLSQGSRERARDFFVRASEATPWFADPYYLLAETYRREQEFAAAVQRWWQVLLCPLPLSSRTSNYDLGDDHIEAEVFEAAVEQLARHLDYLPEEFRNSPLGRLVMDGDPFEPREHITLARSLGNAGDTPGEERELLNALALATGLVDTDDAYDGLVSLYDRSSRGREAAFCRVDRTRRQ